MELFLRHTTRCRVPRRLALHQHVTGVRRTYATAFAKPGSTDRPLHPTAQRATSEKTRLSQRKPATSTSATPSSSSTSTLGSSKLTQPQSRRARMAQLTKDREEKAGEMSNERMLKEIEIISSMEKLASFDVWAKAIANLDLYIPGWRNTRKNASIMDHVRTIWNTQKNWLKNAMNLRQVAAADGFPGVSVRRTLSLELFRIQSTKWLGPFRKIALDTYVDIQRAVAAGDEQTIKKLTIGVHQKRLMDIVRARDPSKVYIWSSEAPAQNEAKVVSLRAFEQNMSRETPKFGNRLTVQALVRFETVQKLDVYTKTGKLIQPSEPKRVVEYLIFQKRMWYDTPWAIRDQLYEGLQGKIQHM